MPWKVEWSSRYYIYWVVRLSKSSSEMAQCCVHPDVMQWEVPCKPCVVVLLKFFDLNLIMWKLTRLECVGSVSDSWVGLLKGVSALVDKEKWSMEQKNGGEYPGIGDCKAWTLNGLEGTAVKEIWGTTEETWVWCVCYFVVVQLLSHVWLFEPMGCRLPLSVDTKQMIFLSVVMEMWLQRKMSQFAFFGRYMLTCFRSVVLWCPQHIFRCLIK